jgi:hypothetical protein
MKENKAKEFQKITGVTGEAVVLGEAQRVWWYSALMWDSAFLHNHLKCPLHTLLICRRLGVSPEIRFH